MTASTPAQTIFLHDYRALSWHAEKVALRFELGEAETYVQSEVHYRCDSFLAEKGELPPLVLDGCELELLELRMDGELLSAENYLCTPSSLTIQPTATHFVLSIHTRIHPERNTALEGLYRSGRTFCTQMEAEGFRRVTYFQDRPDCLSVYTTTVVADAEAYPVLLSNGICVADERLPDQRRAVTWYDPHPKPCYLFALVAGDLRAVDDHFRTLSGREVTLRIWVDPDSEPRALFAMEALKQAMAWDEQAYGREYDLDIFQIVAIRDFNLGAMENKSLNIFNEALVLADARSSSDADFARILSVVGHEYFHNWSGNRVTCRDWFQLSLKEGFTVLRDQQFSAAMGSEAVQRIDDVQRLRQLQFAEDAGPRAHPVRPQHYIKIDNFYTATVYEKGAELIRMMQSWVGKEAFRRGCDLYFERHDGQAVCTEDFVQAIADASGEDLSLFQRWYDQAGTPIVEAEGQWDAAQGSYTLRLSQYTDPTPGQALKKALPIPVNLTLLTPEGKALPLCDSQGNAVDSPLHFTQAEQTWTFTQLTQAPVLSLLGDFSAPVMLRSRQTLADDRVLALHAEDAFNRWEALQRMAHRAVSDHMSGVTVSEAQQALMAIRQHVLEQVLETQSVDFALAAKLLTLPSLGDFMVTLERIDIDALCTALQALRQASAHVHAPLWLGLLEQYPQPDAHDRSANAIGVRALRALAFAPLMTLPEHSHYERVWSACEHAQTMTEELAAFAALVDHANPQREAAIRTFYERWQEDPLVLNKWFATIASSPLADTLERVQALRSHAAFNVHNPNNVRALYGTLARNVSVFHRADAEGYRLVAEAVCELDANNPILAARLAESFQLCHKLDEQRRQQVKKQLLSILARPELSSNTFEVVQSLSHRFEKDID